MMMNSEKGSQYDSIHKTSTLGFVNYRTSIMLINNGDRQPQPAGGYQYNQKNTCCSSDAILISSTANTGIKSVDFGCSDWSSTFESLLRDWLFGVDGLLGTSRVDEGRISSFTTFDSASLIEKMLPS